MCPVVRPPAVAGSFYPAEPRRLEAAVRAHLAAAKQVAIDFPLRILIVPHAGYVYSGPVAAVVMLGPSHYERFTGLALPGVDLLETPLGDVVVDLAGAATARESALVTDSPGAHRHEHSLEVQLPFLQAVASGVSVVPLLTGEVDPVDVAAVVEPLLDKETLLLVSSDLSHFCDSQTARRRDAASAAAIERLDPGALDRESACGRTGIQAALHIAQSHEFESELIDLRNSADTAGSPERVVGYGTFALGA